MGVAVFRKIAPSTVGEWVRIVQDQRPCNWLRGFCNNLCWGCCWWFLLREQLWGWREVSGLRVIKGVELTGRVIDEVWTRVRDQPQLCGVGTRCIIMLPTKVGIWRDKEQVWGEEGGRQCGNLGSGVGVPQTSKWTFQQAVGLDLRTVILASDVAFGKLERVLKMIYLNPFLFF